MSDLREKERERERGKITREATETDESLSATAGWRLDLGTCVAVTLRYYCRIGTASPESCDKDHLMLIT